MVVVGIARLALAVTSTRVGARHGGDFGVGKTLVATAARRTASLGHGHGALSVVVAGTTAVALVVVGCAAANGEGPEEHGNNNEGGRQPHIDQEVLVERSCDTVLLCGAISQTDNHRSRTSGQRSRSNDGQGGDHGNQGGADGEEARAVGKDAKDDGGAEEDEGNDEANLGPLVNGSKSLHAILESGGQGRVGASRVDNIVKLVLKGLGGVGGPVELALAAGGSAVVAVGAVVPEGDVVGVGEAQVAGGNVLAANSTLDGRLGSRGRGRGSRSKGGRGSLDQVGKVVLEVAGGSAGAALEGAGSALDGAASRVTLENGEGLAAAQQVGHLAHAHGEVGRVNLEAVDILGGDSGQTSNQQGDDTGYRECKRHKHANYASEAHLGQAVVCGLGVSFVW